MTETKTSTSHLLSSLLGGLLVGGMLLTYQAMADNDGDPGTDSLPRVVPYSGVMEFNGQPHNGPLDVRFALFGDPEEGASDECEVDAACLWAEEWTSDANNPDSDNPVMVYQGRFSVELGRTIPITDTIYDAGPLWLGMQVKAPGDDAWVSLAGRQRLNPVPYALWSANSANLDIAGDIDVAGNANVDGVLFVGNRMTNPTDANGGRLAVLDTLFVNGGLDIYDRIINPSGTNGGAVQVSDDLHVTGDFSMRSLGNLRYQLGNSTHNLATFSSNSSDCRDDDGCVLSGLGDATPNNSFCFFNMIQSNVDCRIESDGARWRGRIAGGTVGICGINCFRYRE